MGVNPRPSISAVIHWKKHAWNAMGSSKQKTRRKVSCDGTPSGTARKVFNQSIFRLGVVRDLLPGIRPTQHGTDSHEHDLAQLMESSVLPTWIG